MAFVLEMAGVPVKVEHRYAYIQSLCRDYLTEAEPRFAVSATEEEIAAERELGGGVYSDAVCEATCLHRAIVRGLMRYGVMLIHSAVVAVDGEAYVFLARSGVGKSTHLRLWREVFGERAVILNGDKPLFTFEGDRLTVHGSPWRGKEGWGMRASAPVRALCLLERGAVNAIAPASQGEVISRIFHQVLLPRDGADSAQMMAMMNRILRQVPVFRLQCNMDPEAARVAYAGMQGAGRGSDTDRKDTRI